VKQSETIEHLPKVSAQPYPYPLGSLPRGSLFPYPHPYPAEKCWR